MIDYLPCFNKVSEKQLVIPYELVNIDADNGVVTRINFRTDIKKWIDENIQEYYSLKRETGHSCPEPCKFYCRAVATFNKQEDLILFKLRWL